MISQSLGKYISDSYEDDYVAAKYALKALLEYCLLHNIKGSLRIDLTQTSFDPVNFEITKCEVVEAKTSLVANLVKDVNKLTRVTWREFTSPLSDMTIEEALASKFFVIFEEQYLKLLEDPNSYIADILDKVAKLRGAQGEAYSARAHKKAAGLIRKYPNPIGSYKDVIAIKGVGAKIAEKVKEILHTGTTEILSIKSEKDLTLELFQEIWGVGPATAQVWFEEGYRTIADIRKAVEQEDITLTRAQGLGLLNFEDLQKKMNRKDMELIFTKVKEGLIQIGCQDLQAAITGSYRRRISQSKDVDILIWEEQSSSQIRSAPELLTE
ncbi:MAG: helix-hairpin-helix domain-containing protein, partial [Candidatus Roizmanbacteria bacterium]